MHIEMNSGMCALYAQYNERKSHCLQYLVNIMIFTIVDILAVLINN